MTKQEINMYAMRVTQSNRTQLIVIMYEAAIQYLDEAIKALEKGDKESYRAGIRNSKNFVNELSSVLDMKYDISKELFNIYRFINRIMVKAEISCDISELPRIKGILEKLKASFDAVAQNDKSAPLMQNTQHVYAGLTYSKNSLNENFGDVKDINRGYKA